jgi:hypothetical protein
VPDCPAHASGRGSPPQRFDRLRAVPPGGEPTAELESGVHAKAARGPTGLVAEHLLDAVQGDAELALHRSGRSGLGFESTRSALPRRPAPAPCAPHTTPRAAETQAAEPRSPLPQRSMFSGRPGIPRHRATTEARMAAVRVADWRSRTRRGLRNCGRSPGGAGRRGGRRAR